MPKLLQVARQSVPTGQSNMPQASGADFDTGSAGLAAVGKGLSDIDDRLQAAAARKQSRTDTIQRVRTHNQFNLDVTNEWTRIQSEEDVSDPNVLANYGKFMKDQMAQHVGNHGGSAASRASLNAMLEQSFGSHTLSASKSAVAAQNLMIANELDGQQKVLADHAGDAPGEFMSLVESWDRVITDMSGALTPGQEHSYRIAGTGQILKSAIESTLDGGDHVAAQEILNSELASKTLSAEDQRTLKTSVLVKVRESEKGRIAGEQALEKAAAVMGIPVTSLTEEQRLKIAGLATTGKKTFGEKVAELTGVLGRNLTERELLKMGGAEASGDPTFGGSLTGRSLELAIDLSDDVLLGTADERQSVNFEAAYREYTKPVQFKDPQTGDIKTVRREPPSRVKEAAFRMGIVPKSDAPGANESVDTKATKQDRFLDLSGEQDVQPHETLWSMVSAGNVTGPLPALREMVGEIPGVGGALGEAVGSRSATIARTMIAPLQNRMVNLYQNNPKFAEGERGNIKDEISIDPSIFDTPQAYRNRLSAIDRSLVIRAKAAADASQNLSLDAEHRRQATRVFIGITSFRERLGIPPTVKSVEEAQKLPPGTEFLDPSGKAWIVPQTGGTNGPAE